MILRELMEKVAEMARGGSLSDSDEIQVITPNWEEGNVDEIVFEVPIDEVYYDVQDGKIKIYLDVGAAFDQAYDSGYSEGKLDMQTKVSDMEEELKGERTVGSERVLYLIERTIKRIKNENDT